MFIIFGIFYLSQLFEIIFVFTVGETKARLVKENYIVLVVMSSIEPILFICNVMTVVYFVQMANSYLKILGNIYILRERFVKITVYCLAALVITSLIRFLVLEEIYYLQKDFQTNLYFIQNPRFRQPRRVLIYIEKVTPLIVAIYVN